MFCLPAETRHPLSSPGAWCCPDNWPTCALSRSRSRSFSLSLFRAPLFTVEQDLLLSVIANGQPMSLHVWFIHMPDKRLCLSFTLSGVTLSCLSQTFSWLWYFPNQNMYEHKYICECALGSGYLSTSHWYTHYSKSQLALVTECITKNHTGNEAQTQGRKKSEHMKTNESNQMAYLFCPIRAITLHSAAWAVRSQH